MAGVNPRTEEFGCMVTCAINYACGRRTYMPFTVCEFVGPLVPELTDTALICTLREIDEHSRNHDLGDACDATVWYALREKIRTELTERNISFEA